MTLLSRKRYWVVGLIVWLESNRSYLADLTPFLQNIEFDRVLCLVSYLYTGINRVSTHIFLLKCKFCVFLWGAEQQNIGL